MEAAKLQRSATARARSRKRLALTILKWSAVGGLAMAALGAVLIAGMFWHYGSDPDLLVKYLFTSERLSIQVHPNAAQARAGFEREEADGIPIDAPTRRYRDPNHKPEVLVAGAGDKFQDGRLVDEDSLQFLEQLLATFDEHLRSR